MGGTVTGPGGRARRFGPAQTVRQIAAANVDVGDPERNDLLQKLGRWNDRLEHFGAEPLITVDEGRELKTDRLRRVVDATLDQVVDVIDRGRYSR